MREGRERGRDESEGGRREGGVKVEQTKTLWGRIHVEGEGGKTSSDEYIFYCLSLQARCCFNMMRK